MAGRGAVSLDIVIKEGRDGLKTLTVDANALHKIMESNISAAQRFEKKIVGFAALATGVNAVGSAFGQLASTMQSITGESQEFSKAMREANTMAGKDSAGFNKLKGEVADLAKEIPIARDQLANGLYQTISNGVPENNWIEFLNTSARSAVGGLADINQVVGVTSTLIKNYGLEWEAAGDIQDKIQLTAKNGVTSFDQLAQALPRVAGNASTLGVSIDELMGTFATLTGVSGNTAEVSTQLAAIFTSLVKPSSEAAEMAAEMGIQFDAAAIKAAGGFQNFLTQLNASVKSYTQSTGALEQEVYGRLFGSAEALRALIPLQGELSDKFAANVSTMVSSAGTMDAAYNEMAKGGGAVNQMLRNQWGALIDVISSVTSAWQPYVNFISGVLNTGSSAFILIEALKKLNIQEIILTTRTNIASAAMAMLGFRGKSVGKVMQFLSLAVRNAAHSATALRIALRGLLITTGIGIAIAALTAIISHFVDATDDATDSTNKFLSVEERVKRDAEQMEQLRQQEATTLSQTRAALEMNISRLKAFNGTKEQEKKIVNDMNNTYGETMGYFSSVADWYNALISNSEAYCKQMVVEARTRMLANRIAAKQQEVHDLIYDEKGNKKRYSTEKEKKLSQIEVLDFRDGKPYRHTVQAPVWTSEKKEAEQALRDGYKEIADLQKQLQAAAKQAAGITFGVKGSSKRPDYTPAATPASPSGGSRSARTDKNEDVSAVNENAANIKEFESNVKVLRELLETASTDEEAANLNKLIEAWEKKADARRNAGKIGKGDLPVNENAANLDEIDGNVDILQARLRKASAEEAVLINQQIESWGKKAEAIRNAGKAVESNGPILRADARNLAEISENIDFLNDKLNTASIQEAANINRQIEAWEKKADAIRNAGKEAKANFDTYRTGWNNIKSVGGGIDGITDSLEGNGNAWQKVTGIVDGFLQIFDGVSAIIELINGLTLATRAHANAELADTAAVQGKTVATAAETAASVASSAATATETAVSETNTAAKSGEAIANATASGAKMPFPMNLVAIAAGVAAVIGALAAIGSFATGGIVGGNSKSGDKLLARVNSGEMILNATQQRNLFRMLNTPAVAGIPQFGQHEIKADTGFIQSIIAEPVIVGGTLRASGRDLICVLANETRIAGKSGKKTNIKL